MNQLTAPLNEAEIRQAVRVVQRDAVAYKLHPGANCYPLQQAGFFDENPTMDVPRR